MSENKKDNPLLEIIFNIIVPSIILMKLSTPEYLGVILGLWLALAFPTGYAIYSYIKVKKINMFSVFGFLSTLLTGGIALFQLDVEWLAIKEASIPALIAAITIFSSYFGKPLIIRILLNPTMFKTKSIYDELYMKGNLNLFKHKISKANGILALTFIFSSVMNYILTKSVVTSPAGTIEFNEQLGQLTLLSYPIIALPSLFVMFGLMYYVSRLVTKLTGLEFNQTLK